MGLCFLFLCQIGIGQQSLLQANSAFINGDYVKALQLYNKYSAISADPDILERRGIANFKLNKLDNAIWDFTKAKQIGNNSPKLFLLMAQVKQHQKDFQQATFFYKEFIRAADPENEDLRLAYRELKNCTFSSFYKEIESEVLVQNFGDEINSAFDEIFPIQSPQQGNNFYASTNRNLKDFQVMAFVLAPDGEWIANANFDTQINTPKNDIAQDISGDGNAFLYVNKNSEGLITQYFSSFDNEGEQIVIPLPSDILYGAIDIQIIDHTTLVFASDKLEGYGGYDIYTIDYKDGQWSEPMNEGPVINSSDDERSPFYARDGRHIYFSSNRPYAYGGFDIYYVDNSIKKPEAQNMGKPINSTGHDLGYRLDHHGQQAIFCSNRTEGEGGFDLYFAYMQDIKKLLPVDTLEFEFIKDYKNADNLLAATQAAKEQEAADRLAAEELAKAEAAAEKARKEKLAVAEAEKKKEADRLAAEELAKAEAAAEKARKEKLASTQVQKEKEAADLVIAEEAKKNNVKTEKTILKETSKKTSLDAQKRSIKIDKKLFDDYTVFYQDRHDLQTSINREKVKALSLYLEKNKKHKVCLIAHTDYLEPGLPEFVQYNTLKRAITIAELLEKEGISGQRIRIESVAANFPVVRKEIAGSPNEENLFLNRRIDFIIKDKKGRVVEEHNVKEEDIPTYSIDRRYELYKSIRDELYYSVKIASSDRIFKNAILRLYSDIYVRKESMSSTNDYYIGIYTNYKDAEILRDELKNSSSPMAEVVAFYNGKRIEETEIDALITVYPDLQSYKDSE